MNKNDFLHITKTLDKYGLYHHSDNLTKIAQQPPIPDLAARVNHYNDKINSFKNLKDPVQKRMKGNQLKVYIDRDKDRLDEVSYNALMKSIETNLGTSTTTPTNTSANTTTNTNTATQQTAPKNPVYMAGLSNPDLMSNGQKPRFDKGLLPEEKNSQPLQTEWNSYLKSPSFITSLESRIKEEGGINNARQSAPDLVNMYEKAKSGDYKNVGDLGQAEMYGTTSRPNNLYKK
jgi:hypothetical protein